MSRSLILAITLAAALPVAHADEKAAKEPRSDDVICTYEKVTGSNLKKKVCASRGARDEARRQDQESVRRLQGAGRAANRDPSLR